MNSMMGRWLYLALLVVLFFPKIVSALAPPITIFRAAIKDPTNAPLEVASVDFRIIYADPVGTCAIYVEDFSGVDMTNSRGVVNLRLGGGVKIYPAGVYPYSNVYDNSLAFYTCQSNGTYPPASADIRKVIMQFNDGKGWQTLPAVTVNSVPYSIFAETAQTAKSVAGMPTCVGAQVLTFNGTAFTCTSAGGSVASVAATGLPIVVGGTATAPTVGINQATSMAAGYLSSGDWNTFNSKMASNLNSGRIWIGNGSNTATAMMVSGDASLDNTGTLILSTTGVSAGAYSKVQVDTKGRVTSAGSLTSADIAATGFVGAGAQWPTSGANISYSSGNVGIGTTNPTNKLSITDSSTSNTGRDFIRLDSRVTPTANTGSSYNGSVFELNLQGGVNYSNTAFGSSALWAIAYGASTSSIGRINGGQFFIYNIASGTVSQAVGVRTFVENSGGGVIDRTYGMYVTNPYKYNGAMSKVYGIFIENQNAGTTNYSLYSEGVSPSYFAGNLGIGTLPNSYALNVSGDVSVSGAFRAAGVIAPATNNTYTLGNATYRFTEVYATNGVINTSDRREKKNIYNIDLGLDFINKLRPVSYRWNTGVDDDVHYGLIAQEAEQVLSEVGKIKKTSIVTHDKATDRYGVRYSELIAPLVKAVQELYTRFMDAEVRQNTQDRKISSKADKTEVHQLKVENEKLKQENVAQAKEMAELKAYLCDKDKKASICK